MNELTSEQQLRMIRMNEAAEAASQRVNGAMLMYRADVSGNMPFDITKIAAERLRTAIDQWLTAVADQHATMVSIRGEQLMIAPHGTAGMA